MVWNNRAPNYLHIYALGRRIEIWDKGQLARMSEINARQGL